MNHSPLLNFVRTSDESQLVEIERYIYRETTLDADRKKEWARLRRKVKEYYGQVHAQRSATPPEVLCRKRNQKLCTGLTLGHPFCKEEVDVSYFWSFLQGLNLMEDETVLEQFLDDFDSFHDHTQDAPFINYLLRRSRLPEEDFDPPLPPQADIDEFRSEAQKYRKIVSLVHIINGISKPDYQKVLQKYGQPRELEPFLHRIDGKELVYEGYCPPDQKPPLYVLE